MDILSYNKLKKVENEVKNFNPANITGQIPEEKLPTSSDRLRKITVSTTTPSGGTDGDIWLKV